MPIPARCLKHSKVKGKKLAFRYYNDGARLSTMTGAEGSKRQYIPDDRVQFITHQGKQILTIDLSNCPAGRIEKIPRALPEVVSAHPRNSVLILSDFTGASFNDEAIRVMKESAVFDKPYVRKSAWIGAQHIPHEFVETLKRYSGTRIPHLQESGGSSGMAGEGVSLFLK